MAVVRELGLPPDQTNPNGSGVSLGHPIGATGTILAVKALYELRRTGGHYALVTMCIGGGQGIAAGADPSLIGRWIAVGRERAAAARARPHAGPRAPE